MSHAGEGITEADEARAVEVGQHGPGCAGLRAPRGRRHIVEEERGEPAGQAGLTQARDGRREDAHVEQAKLHLLKHLRLIAKL